jgi:hypothetical protein
MSPSDVSSLLSHLWRSLDANSKAQYKQEELRLQNEFRRRSPESMRPPPPPFSARLPLIPSELAGSAMDFTAALPPPPLITLAPITPRSRPAQAITRRFDARPMSQKFHSELEMSLPRAPIHGITSDHGDAILLPSWKS